MRLLVIGAGGHAKVVLDAARTAGFEIAGVVARDPHPDTLLGEPVSADAAGIDAEGFIVAVGDNAARAREHAAYVASGLTPVAVVHPNAVLGTGVSVGAGVFIAAGVVVNADTTLGDGAILNTGCTVDHDCTIGAFSHVGPGAHICGGCSVGDRTLLGIGSCMTPGSSVGAHSVIGAGAAVVGAIDDDVIAMGVPARITRHTEA